ncbi:MAG: MaoC family dehydratase [Sterolibacterium sp.]|jgi:acyl dehydratase|nr:MaoC family dehydratase [Sterolibacterium sp.]MBP9799231.1 MaoC family dehydratase [Sterolibacterium sp.]
MTTVFSSAEEILKAPGTDLGATDWIELTQERINKFADATDDHQWIHVDPVRAKDGPFGACVAHGYLTLSLANLFLPQLVEIKNMRMGVNYGCEKIRFPAPVKAGKRIRGKGEVIAAEKAGEGVQATIRITIEIEGEAKPGCVVDTISRYYF